MITDAVAHDLLGLATTVAAEAAAQLSARVDDERVTVEAKVGPGDILTEVNRDNEALIVRRIREARPDDAILAEEGDARVGTTGLTWVIDPLDGSANYLNHMAPYAVSIAVCDQVDGRVMSPVVGVLHDASHAEVFQAQRGCGTTVNGMPIRERAAPRLDAALIGTGFAHTRAVRVAEAAVAAQVLPRVGDLRRSGAGGVDLCWVAAGRLQAFYQAGLKPWDFAAAQLVVSESGAAFGLRAGLAGSTETVFAVAPELLEGFLAVLTDAGVGS